MLRAYEFSLSTERDDCEMAGGVSFFPWLLFKRFDQFISLSPSNHSLAKLAAVSSANIMLGWGKEGTNKLMEDMGIGDRDKIDGEVRAGPKNVCQCKCQLCPSMAPV